MTDSAAKVNIRLRDGTFEISGSEAFVAEQLENLRELIAECSKNGVCHPEGSEKKRAHEPDEVSAEEIEDILETV